MNNLEPLVTVLHPDRDGKRVSLIDLNKFHALPVGAELYIIPDTHRVVSVEVLKYLLAILDDNMTYAAASEINAIIGKEQS